MYVTYLSQWIHIEEFDQNINMPFLNLNWFRYVFTAIA